MIPGVRTNIGDVNFNFQDSCNCCCFGKKNIKNNERIFINTDGSVERFDLSRTHDQQHSIRITVARIESVLLNISSSKMLIPGDIKSRLIKEAEFHIDAVFSSPITCSQLKRVDQVFKRIRKGPSGLSSNSLSSQYTPPHSPPHPPTPVAPHTPYPYESFTPVHNFGSTLTSPTSSNEQLTPGIPSKTPPAYSSSKNPPSHPSKTPNQLSIPLHLLREPPKLQISSKPHCSTYDEPPTPLVPPDRLPFDSSQTVSIPRHFLQEHHPTSPEEHTHHLHRTQHVDGGLNSFMDYPREASKYPIT